MSDLPQGWMEIPTGEVATLLRGISYKKQDSSESQKTGFLPVLRANNLNDEIVLDELVYVSKDLIKGNQLIKKDDIVFAMSSGSKKHVGKCAIARKDLSASFGAFCGLLRVHEGFNARFLACYFRSHIFRHHIEEISKGTNINNLKREHILDFSLWFPPLNEQRRIVAKIEELFSELDKGIENLKTARQQLKIYRQAVLKHAFEGKFIKKTTVWSERSVKQITTYITSGSRGWARYYADSGDLFIRAQNLKFDRLDLTDIAFVNIPNNAEGTRTKIKKGDLLITITGANVTKSALVESEIGTAYVSQHVALCRLTDKVFSKFLYWFMVAESAGRKQLNKAAYGAGKPGLNLDNIKDVKLLLPSYEEQISIVETIETKLSVCEKFERDIESQIDNCTALRQAILKQAFSGKLVAQDSNDEPASVLLERIEAEKSGARKRRNAA